MQPPNKEKTIRVGVVGVGYLGKFHAEKYANMTDVELVGVVDTNPAQAAAIASQHNTTAYESHRELIGKVDAASIAVPTQMHFDVSRKFLENGIDLLIEKPITSNLEEADLLIDMAEKNGNLIQVGHLERFNPAVVALNGIVHQPRFIESHRLSTFKNRGTDVSVVLDLMIHDIDIIQSCVKSSISGIHAAGISVVSGNIDIANARIEFSNGCVANVTASRISAKNERKIRLFQKDAYISVDFANHEITVIKPDENEKNGIIPGMRLNQQCFTKSDALDDELKAFVHAVRTRTQPEVTGQMGREALRTALSIMEQINRSNEHFINPS